MGKYPHDEPTVTLADKPERSDRSNRVDRKRANRETPRPPPVAGEGKEGLEARWTGAGPEVHREIFHRLFRG